MLIESSCSVDFALQCGKAWNRNFVGRDFCNTFVLISRVAESEDYDPTPTPTPTPTPRISKLPTPTPTPTPDFSFDYDSDSDSDSLLWEKYFS